MLQHLRQQAHREGLAESRKHTNTVNFRLGPIRSALALIQTPHRFRTNRQLWTTSDCGWRRATLRKLKSQAG